jgi:hypothetical protein
LDKATIGFVGVVVGALLTGVLNYFLQRAADKRRWEHEQSVQQQRWDREDEIREQQEQSTLVQQYLFQFQDAVEALWYRLRNLAFQGGRYVMVDDYFEITTMYALGRVLAIERMLVLQGAFPQIYEAYPEVGVFLRERHIDRGLEGVGFYQYDRISLAEAVIVAEDENVRVSSYLEFRRRYEAEGSLEREWLKPAKDAIERLDRMQMAALLASLHKVALILAGKTNVSSTLPEQKYS